MIVVLADSEIIRGCGTNDKGRRRPLTFSGSVNVDVSIMTRQIVPITGGYFCPHTSWWQGMFTQGRGGGTAYLRVGTQNKTTDPWFCATTALSH